MTFFATSWAKVDCMFATNGHLCNYSSDSLSRAFLIGTQTVAFPFPRWDIFRYQRTSWARLLKTMTVTFSAFLLVQTQYVSYFIFDFSRHGKQHHLCCHNLLILMYELCRHLWPTSQPFFTFNDITKINKTKINTKYKFKSYT